MDAVAPAVVAALLDAAHADRRTLDASAVAVGDLTSAYAVQRALTSLRLSRGDAVVGWKLGYTTRAMRDQMGIDAPNLGPLLASMRVEPGARATGIHPRVEPEIAFVMAGDPGPAPSADDVLAQVAEVRLALEIVDSVWSGYRFDLEHNTADGSSAHGFVLGDLLRPGTDVVVELRGTATVPASGSGRVGDAAESTAWLCGELAHRGLSLRRGDVVLTGGLTAAARLEGVIEAVEASAGARVEVRA
ncbi:MAG TPA: hypothetical protein VFL59_03495 [Candidatus Nanopelagicales bacterium]|nr:hypothetical protein [Candidatus Nanopelagicales bacterium]